MRTILKTIVVLLISCSMTAQVNPKHERVRSYEKKNGTVVKEHERTKRNKTTEDNYSHKGNTNPYTGKKGYKKD